MLTRIKEFFNKKPVNKNQTILIVDDSPTDQKLAESILQKNGYRTFIAENGAVGLELAKKERPDLILLDCEMPVMNGLQLCEKLKEDNDLMDIPVVFLTSMDTPKNIVECFQSDAENFLAKPVNPKILTHQIASILREASKK